MLRVVVAFEKGQLLEPLRKGWLCGHTLQGHSQKRGEKLLLPAC